MHGCPICYANLNVVHVACAACGVGYEGRFELPRLARLAPDHQQLAEQIVLAAGNLKQVAGVLEVSYPTLRKRLDGLIEALGELRMDDQERTKSLLDSVESGAMGAEQAARLIKELNGAA
jgi:hypothetical protein